MKKMGLDTTKNALPGIANSNDTDRLAPSCRLISAFDIHLLKVSYLILLQTSIISSLATSKISIFYLLSVAEQAVLNVIL